MVIESIASNSYRVLGVYANSSKRDILSKKGKFNAFLRVKKTVPAQPTDLTSLLPPIDRSIDAINKAEGDISIIQGQLQQSMFWFVNTGMKDEEAMKFLNSGATDNAIRVWRGVKSVNGVHNLMVSYLLAGNLRDALLNASRVFGPLYNDWLDMLSVHTDITSSEAALMFVERLNTDCPKEMGKMDWNGLPAVWRKHLKSQNVNPIIDELTKLLEKSKSNTDVSPMIVFNVAQNLFDNSKPLLEELSKQVASDDLIMRSMADKIYTEVLKNTIDCFNNSFDELKNGNDGNFRVIGPGCYNLVKEMNLNWVSDVLKQRIEKNLKTLEDNCSDIEDTINQVSVSSEDICWFCGEHAELKKEYKFTRSETNGNTRYTYSKTVPVYLCDKCEHEMKQRDSWTNTVAVVFFVIIALVIILFFNFWLEWEFWGFVFMAIPVALVAGFLSGMFSDKIRRWLDKDNIREFKRDIDDHPLVKYVKSEGYS